MILLKNHLFIYWTILQQKAAEFEASRSIWSKIYFVLFTLEPLFFWLGLWTIYLYKAILLRFVGACFSFFLAFGIYFFLLSFFVYLSYFLITTAAFNYLRKIALYFSLIICLFYLFISYIYLFLQSNIILDKISYLNFWIFFGYWEYSFLLDPLAISLLFLTTTLIFICVLSCWTQIFYKLKMFYFLLFVTEFLLLNLFLTSNLGVFYVFFEGLLIPMVCLIGVWGTRKRKIYANFFFFFYTFIGSLFLLFAILILYSNSKTLEYAFLSTTNFSLQTQFYCWICLFCAFSIKVPIFPFHAWLPEAHVEAPTVGSILLAGIILKLGIYAYLRFLVPFFPQITLLMSSYVQVIGCLSILFASCMIIRQIDLKKIIAYSSIIHMNYVICGLFCFNKYCFVGSLIILLSHGLISSALFFLIGTLYDRYGTRNLKMLFGVSFFMPIYSFFFFLINIANMGFPGTLSFVGEFLLLVGLCNNNIFLCFLLTCFIIFTGIFTIWLINRILYGGWGDNFWFWIDLTKREIYILSFFTLSIVILGLYPSLLLTFLENYVYNFFTIIQI